MTLFALQNHDNTLSGGVCMPKFGEVSFDSLKDNFAEYVYSVFSDMKYLCPDLQE